MTEMLPAETTLEINLLHRRESKSLFKQQATSLVILLQNNEHLNTVKKKKKRQIKRSCARGILPPDIRAHFVLMQLLQHIILGL